MTRQAYPRDRPADARRLFPPRSILGPAIARAPRRGRGLCRGRTRGACRPFEGEGRNRSPSPRTVAIMALMQNLVIALVHRCRRLLVVAPVRLDTRHPGCRLRPQGRRLCLIAVAGFLTLRGAFNAGDPAFSSWGWGCWENRDCFRAASPGRRNRPASARASRPACSPWSSITIPAGWTGTVLAGPFKGRLLSALGDDELQAFHRQCTGSMIRAAPCSKPGWTAARPAGARPGTRARGKGAERAVRRDEPGRGAGRAGPEGGRDGR